MNIGYHSHYFVLCTVLPHTFASLNPHNIVSDHCNRFYYLSFMDKKLELRRHCPKPTAWLFQMPCVSFYRVQPITAVSSIWKKRWANTTEPEFSFWEKELDEFGANSFSKRIVCSLLGCRLVWLLCLFPGSRVLRVKSWCTFTGWYQRGFQSCDLMVSLQRYPGL